jgi:hypothetical protein
MVKEGAIMFKEYMMGTTDPTVQAVVRAAADINNGVFSLREAANFYKVSSDSIVRFMSESADYDVVFNREKPNENI